MRTLLLACCVLPIALAGHDVVRGEQRIAPPQLAPSSRVTAPVYYEDMMLLLTTKQGTAAVVFYNAIEEPGRNGVAYRYRFRPKDGGKEQAGVAEVFESLDRKTPGQTVLRAGPISEVVWSKSSDKKGWIYYLPEQVQVKIATARYKHPLVDGQVEHLDSTDLSRFDK